MLSKAETIAQKIEMKCERQQNCYEEMEELTRRLRKLRVMLQKIGGMKEGIQDVDTVDTIKLFITRYDQCVKAVDLAMLHSAVRVEQRKMAVKRGYGPGRVDSDDDAQSLLQKDSKTFQINGQQITVQASEKIEEALERSKRLSSLRKDVSDVMEVFEDVKELVDHQHEDVETIHDNILETKENTKHAEKELAKAIPFKHSALGWGLAGAALGGVLGGPVGLALGSKAGAAIGLALGGTTGTMSALGLRKGIKKQHEKVQEEAEMQELESSSRRSEEKN